MCPSGVALLSQTFVMVGQSKFNVENSGLSDKFLFGMFFKDYFLLADLDISEIQKVFLASSLAKLHEYVAPAKSIPPPSAHP